MPENDGGNKGGRRGGRNELGESGRSLGRR